MNHETITDVLIESTDGIICCIIEINFYKKQFKWDNFIIQYVKIKVNLIVTSRSIIWQPSNKQQANPDMGMIYENDHAFTLK